MEDQPYTFLTEDEAKHIWAWLDKHGLDRTSCHEFLKDKKFETFKSDDFFTENTHDYAHVDEDAVAAKIVEFAKDFDKEVSEFLIFPAGEDTWFESETIDEPVIVPVNCLTEFLSTECMVFGKDYFITSKDFQWWILLCHEEEMHMWRKHWDYLFSLLFSNRYTTNAIGTIINEKN